MAKKQPLKGCVVAFAGNFYGRNQTTLLNQAERLGAHTSKSITPGTTHLVTTQTECSKRSSKVKQAQEQGVFIINISWLDESESLGAKQKEADYALSKPSASSGSTPSSSSSAPPPAPTKRAASDSPAPEAKKTKLEQASEKAPALGKSQLAKDTSIQVPIDEGVQSHYSVYVGDDGIIWDATLK